MFNLFVFLLNQVQSDEFKIDSAICHLHYKFTRAILLFCCLSVGLSEFSKKPINCYSEAVNPDVLNAYCWITGTFTVPEVVYDNNIRGFGAYIKEDTYQMYHKYYQWIVFALFFQACLFYLPHYIWNYFENGRIAMLTCGLKCFAIEDSARDEMCEKVANYLRKNRNRCNVYLYRYVLCELLYLVNVICQIFFMRYFIGGNLWDCLNPIKNVNSLKLFFPKRTKCTFNDFGPSGSTQDKDALCVLPINVLNEKIYFGLIIWFHILAYITMFVLLHRIFLLISAKARTCMLRIYHKEISNNYLKEIESTFDAGDWFLFYQIGENTNFFILNKILMFLLNIEERQARQNQDEVEINLEGNEQEEEIAEICNENVEDEEDENIVKDIVGENVVEDVEGENIVEDVEDEDVVEIHIHVAQVHVDGEPNIRDIEDTLTQVNSQSLDEEQGQGQNEETGQEPQQEEIECISPEEEPFLPQEKEESQEEGQKSINQEAQKQKDI